MSDCTDKIDEIRENEFLKDLNNRSRLLDIILQTSMDAFWIMDAEGKILDINQAVIDLFGYSRKELINKNINEIHISKEDIKVKLDEIKAKKRDRFEIKYSSKNGEIRDLEISITFVECLEEPIFNMFARDITERKNKQRELEKAYQDNKDFLDELRKQNNRINTILQTSMDAFWVMNTDGDILEINEAFNNLFGYSLFETMNMNISDFDVTKNQEELKEELNEIRLKGKDRFETKFRLKNGQVIDLEISVTFVDSLDQPIFQVFGRDITGRKKKEIELRQAQKQLIQSEKMAALGRLVAGVAHEINTPVGIGVTAASYLSEKTEEIVKLYKDGKLKRKNLEKFLELTWESSEVILKNLKNASELINKFKLVAADQTNNKKRKFNLREYLNDIIISLKPKLIKTKHTISVNCDQNLEINNYPGAISQIITNLMMNSLIHGFDNIDAGKINIEVLDKKEDIQINYSDNGQGIPKEHLNKIFEPFFTTKRGQGGTGLGLNLIYNLVTNILKGELECKSVLGEGATFTIRLAKDLEIQEEI